MALCHTNLLCCVKIVLLRGIGEVVSQPSYTTAINDKQLYQVISFI